ncbi:MAG: DUF1772 domain-containing protein [Cellvibrionaceae bacterium]
MMVLLIVITGLMAGVYFTFSVVIMKSFALLPELDAARAMNKINEVIVKTIFLPVFFGSTLCFVGLILWSIVDWRGMTSALVVVASIIYLIGMSMITAFGNVPLNNGLKINSDDEAKLVEYWRKYLAVWTGLNHLRTISCIATCTLLAIAYS